MKKRDDTKPADPELAEKRQALLDLTGAFCDALACDTSKCAAMSYGSKLLSNRELALPMA